jgi:hypothetical protein
MSKLEKLLAANKIRTAEMKETDVRFFSVSPNCKSRNREIKTVSLSAK